MHDSLPTGDLTELLGAPSAACDTTSTAPLLEPYDPDHALQPLSSGLSADAPYHLVVVGGQEVPVGYGGWSGPNWTETIQRWLAGGSKPLQTGAAPLTPKEKDVPQSIGSNRLSKEVLPLASPNTAHKQLLESQESETLALPEEILDTGQNESSLSVAVHPEDRPGSLNRFLDPDGPRGQLSNTDVHNEQISPRTPFSSAMSRNNSSDTANTDASARTNVKSVASQDGHVTDAPEAPEATTVQDSQSPYILVTKERLMGIYCSLWVHRSAAHLVQGSSTGTVTAGLLAGKVGNKGAACISLKIVDTRLLFVCAHLAAHSEKSALRQANVKKIKEELVIDTFLEDKDKKDKPRLKRGLSFSRPVQDRDRSSKEVASSRGMLSETEPGPGMDITELFDYTFWFGDRKFTVVFKTPRRLDQVYPEQSTSAWISHAYTPTS